VFPLAGPVAGGTIPRRRRCMRWVRPAPWEKLPGPGRGVQLGDADHAHPLDAAPL